MGVKRNRQRGNSVARRKAREEEEAKQDVSSEIDSIDAEEGEDESMEEDAEFGGSNDKAPGEDKLEKGAVIVAGTYEGGLVGLEARGLKQIFGFAPHIGCVKALHCSRLGRLASGGTDHSVRLFDLGRSVELGELQEHQDSLTCVEFWGITTLVTGSEDGQVCIWRSSDWELLLKFRAHKVAVVSLAVHPSGKLMASAGRDRGVRLWDMTRGTSAANLTLETDVPIAMKWSPTGDVLSVLSTKELLAVSPRTGALSVYKDPNSSGFLRLALTTVLMLSDTAIILGDGRGDLRVLALSGDSSVGSDAGIVETCKLPENPARGRVKALVWGGSGVDGGDGSCWFVAGFTAGRIEVWSCSSVAASELHHFSLIRAVDTSVRLTCLAVWPGPGVAAKAAAEIAEAAAKAKAVAAAAAGKTAVTAKSDASCDVVNAVDAVKHDSDGGKQASTKAKKKRRLSV
eukprot:TRINITY_DN31097_c0_g2_i1.p1 TRINITY_DN31097_c0_g2~~TRINITY_DN31097_c0_g2_i1.p1  ORF type:complete len:457 (+),score=108.43 TRINITY_DN31097_c0_g2_i1:90-1460(+)